MGRRAKPAKVKAKAKRRPLVRKAPTKGAPRVHELEKRLNEALGQVTDIRAQQTATSEILRVIASSPTGVQGVFEAIARSAARLCDAIDAAIHRLDGASMRVVAHHGPIPLSQILLDEGRLLDAGSVTGRAILERRRIHVEDLASADEFPLGRDAARRLGYRTTLAVPLLRQGTAIGAIVVRREEIRPFTDSQMELLETFADQAVIAIENVRLLSELQDKNEALTRAHAQVSESLEQQTATSEILRVISQSPTDIQPVFDAIVENARRLLNGFSAGVTRLVSDELHLAAFTRTTEAGDALIKSDPSPLVAPGSLAAQVVRGRVPSFVTDIETDERVDAARREMARQRGYRSVVHVPMLREGLAIGTISVTRLEPGPFAADEIALLQTFADQAVIAIENVRLFTELQTSNRELTTALDTQTATSDILRVISRSQSDVQPVFDAIMASALRLLLASRGALTRLAGDQIELVALASADDTDDAALRARFPQSLHSEDPHAQAIRARVPLNVADAETDSRWPEAARASARVRGYRSAVVVPMLRHDEVIGSIAVTRREPGGFTDDEIALLQTFADQAVIAIENARLFTELQERTQDLTRSVSELRALGEIGQAIGSTLELQTVLRTIAARATELASADAGVIYEYDAERAVFEPRATERLEAEIVQALVASPVRKGQGATGRLAETREPIQMDDVRSVAAQVPVREALIRAGYRALLAVPLLREDDLIGGLTVFRKSPGEFPANVVALLQTFATQSALAIQNARLFRELEIKSRELEVASQHKSEFLASMSHELRTPLNAIIGFSDVLLQGMFGETNEKQTEYLRDILTSGQHLLSLINDILDLSKIEAGRMDLDLADFDLPSAIDDALLLMRERASRRGLALERHVDERLGEIRADQRKVKQVLLNLLSNAVKFTPEGGRIDVRAGVADGRVEISVTDTGIGIAPEDQEAVFEEFRQVGKAEKKAEGTGLGLALCRKFVELHGGRIWVKSQIGTGSTFTFTMPLSR